MTAKGSQNNNFAQIAIPGGESGDPTITVEATAPLCDEFGRLIVVIDGLVATSGSGGGGGGSGLATELDTTDLPVNVSSAAPPAPSDVLTAASPTAAVWLNPSVSFSAAFADAIYVDVVLVANVTPLYGNSSDLDGVGGGAEIVVLATAQTIATENGFWKTQDNPWIRAPGLPLPGATPIGQIVIAYNGTQFAGTMWVYAGGNVWNPILAGSPIIGGDSMLRVGNEINFVGPLSNVSHGNLGGGALHAVATTSVNGFISSADQNKVNALSRAYKDPVTVVATAAITLAGLQTIDGISVGLSSRVLVTAQADATTNGIYTPAAGSWARSSDAANTAFLYAGALIPVNEGTSYSDTIWMLTTNAVTLGVTNLTFKLIGGLRGVTDIPTSIVAGVNSNTGSLPRWASADHVHAWNSLYKDPVRIAATLNIAALSGLLTIDTVTLVNGDRVLLTTQATGSQNGIWIANSGAWTRALDADSPGDFVTGTVVYVNEGSTNLRTLWALTTLGVISIGTTSLAFAVVGSQRSAAAPTPTAPGTAGSSGALYQWTGSDHSHAMHSPHNGLNGFRISNNPSSGVPLENTLATTVYLVSDSGNRISMSADGITWVPVVLSSLPSVAVTGQNAGIPCDVFATYGTLTSISLTLQPWTNATTRAFALAQITGVWCRSSAPTLRYLGTILPVSATTYDFNSAPSAGIKAVCGIWNQDNRIQTGFQWLAPAGTASPGTANVWATLPGMSGPHVELMLGQSIDAYSAEAISAVGATSTTIVAAIGIGVDSTSAVQGMRGQVTGLGTSISPLHARRTVKPAAAGVKNVNMLAQVSALGPTFLGSQDLTQSGLLVDFWH